MPGEAATSGADGVISHQASTATTNTPSTPATGSSQAGRAAFSLARMRVRCWVAPAMRSLPGRRARVSTPTAPAGAPATHLCMASTKAAPVLKRCAGSLAIRPSMSGCSQACSSGSDGTGWLTCISATVKASLAW